VKAWLVEHGIADADCAPAQDWISIVVPIEKAEELLQTSYSKYEHKQGHTINRATEWSLPLHLFEHIDVVSNAATTPTSSCLHSVRRPKTLPTSFSSKSSTTLQTIKARTLARSLQTM